VLLCLFITFTLMHLVPAALGPEKSSRAGSCRRLNARYDLISRSLFNTPIFSPEYSTAILASLTLIRQKCYPDSNAGFPKTAILGQLLLFCNDSWYRAWYGGSIETNTWIDYVVSCFPLSSPAFRLCTGYPVMIVFSVILHWFPTGGWGSPSQIVMPAIALAALPAAFIARITRASTLETMRRTMCAPPVLKVCWNGWF